MRKQGGGPSQSTDYGVEICNSAVLTWSAPGLDLRTKSPWRQTHQGNDRDRDTLRPRGALSGCQISTHKAGRPSRALPRVPRDLIRSAFNMLYPIRLEPPDLQPYWDAYGVVGKTVSHGPTLW
jgi:hypothetical protein